MQILGDALLLGVITHATPTNEINFWSIIIWRTTWYWREAGCHIISASKGPSQPVGVKSKFDLIDWFHVACRGRMCMYDEQLRIQETSPGSVLINLISNNMYHSVPKYLSFVFSEKQL
jgi:hypothetical protein